MFIKLKEASVLFSKFFSPEDGRAAIGKINELAPNRVLFIDTAATSDLVATVQELVVAGYEVYVRDHHRGEGRSPEASEVAALQLEALLGNRCQIVTRQEAPACAQLVELGEFAGAGTVIVADPDLDGLSAAMKASGLTYEGQGADAAVFDHRPSQSADTLTEMGWLVVRGLSTLPPYNPKRPEASLAAKAELFGQFAAASQGDAEALVALEDRVATYEAGVTAAQDILATAVTQVAPAAWMADAVGVPAAYDLSTLSVGLAKRGAKITVIRKDSGPIAGVHGGVQYSLAVVQSAQEEIDLRGLVLPGTEVGVPAGLLSNTSFLLHCSEAVWKDLILPGLKKIQ